MRNPSGRDRVVVEVQGVVIGAGEPVLIAGPCSVETEARTLAIARMVRDRGAHLFRAGAYKPRTSPSSFQGLRREGLPTLQRVRAETGLGVVTEVLTPEDVDTVAEVADILQVGARNMQNTALLTRLGECDRPVLLKRGPSATLEEWLQAAAYIVAGGNPRVILCERGIRTFDDHSRFTLDLSVIPAVRERSLFPLLVDPSHATGRREAVLPMARAALAAGADGILVEVHDHPGMAYSDGRQTIDPATFSRISADALLLHQVLRKESQPLQLPL
jgi:3-deoxy-7-phosphoheptulonate synthase